MLQRLLEIPGEFWAVLSEMAPYLLFGFLVAGLLSVFILPETVERHLGGRGLLPVLKAAAFGVPLPLCSCGVIPVAASLRRHGASRGATVGFLISTPQTGVDSIMVTYSLLGGTFAIFRPVVALISGVLGGAIVSALEGDGSGAVEAPPACHDDCCNAPPGQGGGKLWRALKYGFGTLPQDIGRSMLIGLLLAALITAVVPRDFFAPVLGGGVLAMVLMMLLGIPVYVCATASVPVAAALIAKGVSPGAALVFLMTGPATNAATIATIWKVMGRRTAVIYLATVAGTALASGLALDYVFHWQGVKPGQHPMWMLPKEVNWACAVVLLGVLGLAVGRSVVHRARHRHDQAPGDGHAPHAPHAPAGQAGEKGEMVATLEITGMTCNHCRQAVQRALRECRGAESADVDLDLGRATVTGPADAAELVHAVEALGYGAKPLDSPGRAGP